MFRGLGESQQRGLVAFRGNTEKHVLFSVLSPFVLEGESIAWEELLDYMCLLFGGPFFVLISKASYKLNMFTLPKEFILQLLAERASLGAACKTYSIQVLEMQFVEAF